jgi:Zn-dependent peptidase ImmA (M78 family)/DNA-binding XRE family transcriptional regulator
MFNPERLALARRRKGLNKKELADKLGLAARSVTAFEAGEFPPSDETLQQLAKYLAFPVEFFYRETVGEPAEQAASFRALTKLTASNRHAALAAGALGLELSDWIERRFNLPSVDLPDLKGQEPSVAAELVRQQWAIGERSIRNMVHLLEAKGVRVFSLAEETADVDAFSFWRERKPYVFLNTFKSSEHARFDAAHELGHLVLHKHGAPNGQLAEKEANSFASAFLMPRATVIGSKPTYWTVRHLIALKRKWLVSAAALAFRLRDLGVLTDWQYRTLFIELNKRGYLRNEPVPAPREKSLIWEKVFQQLRAEGIGKEHIAAELALPVEEIEKLVWGLVTMSLSNGSAPLTTTKRRANLRVV